MKVNLAVVPLGLVICYLGLAALMLLRRRIKGKTERTLFAYLIALAAWNASFAVSMIAPQNRILAGIREQAALVGLVILAVLFLNLTHAFLRQVKRFAMAWWILGIVSLLIVILLNPESHLLNLPSVQIARYRLGQGDIILLFSVFAWAGFTIAAILATGRVYRQTTSPMYRNRYRYWLLALGLMVIGDLFFAIRLSYFGLFGMFVKLGSVLVLYLAVLRQNLVDVKSLYRRAFGYIVVTLIAIAISVAFVALSTSVLGAQDFLSILIGVGAAAIVVSFGFSPTLQAIQRFIDRRLFHIEVNYEAALRTYGEKVIETLELEPLADLAMNTLVFTTGARRGGLYLVQEGKREIGGLLLTLVKRIGDLPVGDFELHPDSLLALRLSQSHEPRTQYEIDLHEDFADVPTAERAWLRALNIEVLVPIHTQSKMIGLIVLGAKGSGESYSTSEIEWFKAMADQTAVALQNARLFDQVQSMSVNVMRLNADLQQAYQQLQEVDRLKSAFIGVITHELRSPFVAAGFSVQLLDRYAQEGMLDELQDQAKQLDKELGEGRRMIDNVISFASLLSRQGDLNPEETDFAELVRSTIAPLEKMAVSRNISLQHNVSAQLPAIRIDKIRMSEAIYHLVHNAIKFNREGGTARVACWSTDSHVVFKVEDTGQGITTEKLANIWNAFTQAADDVKRGVEGMGLGLALVKFVIEAHDGEVWASSKYGEGSTFGFRVPQRPTIQSPMQAG